jgi:hypothetical protein
MWDGALNREHSEWLVQAHLGLKNAMNGPQLIGLRLSITQKQSNPPWLLWKLGVHGIPTEISKYLEKSNNIFS